MDFSSKQGGYSKMKSIVYDHFATSSSLRLGIDCVQRLDLGDRKATILDVGCGGGQLIKWILENHPNVSCVGVEPSDYLINRARQRCADYGSRVEFVQSTVDEMLLAGKFDIVISIGSIKHWPNPVSGLRECVEKLKPGGKLRVVELSREFSAKEFARLFRLPLRLSPLLNLFRPFWQYGMRKNYKLEEYARMAQSLALSDTQVRHASRYPASEIYGQTQVEP